MDEKRKKEIAWRSKLYWEIFDYQLSQKSFLSVEELIKVTNVIYEKWTLDDIHDSLNVITEEILKERYGKA